MDFLGIHWAGSDRIIFLPIFLILIFFVIRRFRQSRTFVKYLVHANHRKMILKNFSFLKHATKAIALSTALLFLFLAFLQPQWEKKEQNIEQVGRDVLIVLDVSRSMQAKDVKPSRLAFAKLKVRNLLDKLPCERVGLVVFSGSALVQCPLTGDHSAFLMFLDNVDTEMMSLGTTALDAALKKSLDVFTQAQGRKNKIVVVLTDGEDFSTDLDAVSKNALRENMRLFAVGVGTPEGAPIPKVDIYGKSLGHEVDESGKIVLSKLDEKVLQKICTDLHGFYVRATFDDQDIHGITSRIKAFEKEKFMDKSVSLYEEKYPWFLGIAWICLVVEWIL